VTNWQSTTWLNTMLASIRVHTSISTLNWVNFHCLNHQFLMILLTCIRLSLPFETRVQALPYYWATSLASLLNVRSALRARLTVWYIQISSNLSHRRLANHHELGLLDRPRSSSPTSACRAAYVLPGAEEHQRSSPTRRVVLLLLVKSIFLFAFYSSLQKLLMQGAVSNIKVLSVI